MVDTLNRWAVAGQGESSVRILNPPSPALLLARDDALVLAAWIVAIADPTQEAFPTILEAVIGE